MINFFYFFSNALRVSGVSKTFDRHLDEIYNAIITQKSSAKHENINGKGKIQSTTAKAKGFLNFKRFRLNVLFYFDKPDINPQKKLLMGTSKNSIFHPG